MPSAPNPKECRAMETTAPEELPRLEPALRTIAMPADANPRGDIFGGWLLAQMDLAGSTVAIRRAQGRVATVAVTSMTFHKPVFVGDELSCFVEVEKVGRTSIAVRIESWVRRGISGEAVKVTAGLFTYVAIGADRRPRPIDPIGDALVG
jgi:acyl-CoA thioesterase YciA